MIARVFDPGEQGPEAGLYEELNVFGSVTGKTIFMAEGEEFPHAPRGFTWRPLSQWSIGELPAKAAEYTRVTREPENLPDL